MFKKECEFIYYNKIYILCLNIGLVNIFFFFKIKSIYCCVSMLILMLNFLEILINFFCVGFLNLFYYNIVFV